MVFVAAPLLPTAAVTVDAGRRNPIRRVVQPEQRLVVGGARGAADFQTWQIEPFAKANLTVTTVWVAMGRSPGSPAYACGFSAHAMKTSEPPQEG